MTIKTRANLVILSWLLVGLVLGLTSGCGLFKRAVKADAVNENCDASCRLPCDATVPLWRPVDPDDPKAWDEYPKAVVLPLVDKLEACDVQRLECVKCLDRLKEAGVTK